MLQGTLTEFGGFFKEAITVSCLKTQSYIVAVKIMKDRTISGQKVNRNCFASLPGVQEKERIFPILQRWALGQIDRKGANKEWEETKVRNLFIMIPIFQLDYYELCGPGVGVSVFLSVSVGMLKFAYHLIDIAFIFCILLHQHDPNL